jgi:hypothetical protein
MNKVLIRPALGLLQGLITLWLLYFSPLGLAGTIAAVIVFTFPLFAMQVKLPDRASLGLGLGILITMSLVYGYTYYYLGAALSRGTELDIPALLTVQCSVSAFILFIFYCVAVQENTFNFPYATLFSEAWQVILKLFFGKILVISLWGLCLLASLLFKLLNISLIHEIVTSMPFLYLMTPFFFGIAMTILHEYEEVLTKCRNILLVFCKVLYPLLVIINISFLVILPFANTDFAGFWQIIIVLSVLNLILFNGIYQSGLDTPPYPQWLCGLINITFVLNLLYSLYILKFPWELMNSSEGIPALLFLLSLAILALYNLLYTLAIFFSTKPWLSLIQIVNKALALLIAFMYLGLAFPWFGFGLV